MLEGLDDISWGDLHHAYGPASDVPDWIRGLVSVRRRVRQESLDQLWNAIFHQGTLWEATSYAIPFMVELAAIEGTHDRVELLRLISACAVGFEEQWLSSGFDAARVREDQAGWEENPYYADQIGPYDAACRSAPTLIELLGDPDPAVRRGAVFTLAFLPDVAERSLPAIRSAARHERDLADRANALLSLGLLAQPQPTPEDVGLFGAAFDDADSWLVRFAGAVGLVRTTGLDDAPDAANLLVEVIATPRDDLPESDLWWNGGDLVGLAAIVIGLRGSDIADATIVTLADALTRSRFLGAVTLAEVLFDVLFPAGEAEVPTMVDELMERQQKLVHALAATDAWWIPNTSPRAHFANFSRLVSAYGLPAHQDGITRWLHGAALEDCLLPGQRRRS